jgi:hypothetical protein
MKVVVPVVLQKATIYGVLTLVMVLLGASGGGGVLVSSASAEACPNEDLRSEEAYAQRLPDCRAYEQVSPVEKNFADAVGNPGLVQASPSGEAVTFFSLSPFPGAPGAADFVTYLSTRGEVGWVTQGLLPPANPASSVGAVALTSDLSLAIIVDFPSSPPPAQGATIGRANYYVRNNLTGSYQLLAGPGGEAHFADATADDSRILFEDEAQLAPGAVREVPNLYEWHDGQVSLVAGDAVAGPGGPALEEGRRPGGATSEFYTQGTISEDGSRVFFSDLASGKIYVREEGEGIVPVSGEEAADWQAATPDGRYVFYTEGGTLYRFGVESKMREGIAKGVIGTLGVSDDGSYVYYVDNGDRLSEWHDGATNFTDKTDWLGYCLCNGSGSAGGEKSASVAPNGMTSLFSSHGQLYIYDAVTSTLTCISCNPDGIPAYLTHSDTETAPRSRNPFITRNLSANGDRVFFESEAALVPQDTNGKMDVYEWEREGTLGGSCLVGEGDEGGGCLYLISTGASEGESYFGDASVSGNDVFFFTRESLVRQDDDNNVDAYDARVGGGISAQNPQPLSTPCVGEACRGATASPPNLGPPSTTTLSGFGNRTPANTIIPVKKLKKGIKKLKKGKRKRSRKRPKARPHAVKDGRARKANWKHHS